MFQKKAPESIDEREKRILAWWKEESIFEKSVLNREGAPLFAFYDGPPFATGLPHYGHLLAGSIKDAVLRYKTQQGFCVPRNFGWDCHGLPVENEIEKSHNLTGAKAIEKFGVAAFNEACQSIVMRHASQWENTVERSARWVSWKDNFKTMDLSFMESVWWAFSELDKKGLIYEGIKVMPFSTKLGTPLSQFEANLSYKEVTDRSCFVRCQSIDDPHCFFLIWTTTPWTLPSNAAILVNQAVEYAQVQEGENSYIVAKNTVEKLFANRGTIIRCFLGDTLLGKRYRPLFSYFSKELNKTQAAFTIIDEPSVSDQEGTGLVHAAPAFGEVDFFACARHEIPVLCPIDNNGKFTAQTPDLEGFTLKEAEKPIFAHLKKEGLFHKEQHYTHRYPFCWRSDTPLIYKAVSSWFVRVEAIKDRLLAANETINWVPEHIKTGRFGKWLENVRDWAISRNRYWGTPIPVWKSNSGKCKVIASKAELEALTGQSITNIHRQYIDQLEFYHEGEKFTRISEVFDCWFESGSMPYAKIHYPFENQALFEKNFPADFIAEGIDQTRGWFYTLLVLGVALFDKAPFKNVVVNGILLAENGAKMSKSLKNYPEPTSVIESYGADALRLYLLSSPAVRAEDLRFSDSGVELITRQFIIPLWNAFSFLSTYAAIGQWNPSDSIPPQTTLDAWLASITQHCIQKTVEAMDRYHLDDAVMHCQIFVEQVTNWYIRRSRSRFWSEEASIDRQSAFSTLYTALKSFVCLAAPLAPFLCEAIYQELRAADEPVSVHLTRTARYDASLHKPELEAEMSAVQTAVSLGHSLRKVQKIKVRQPLSTVRLIVHNPETAQQLSRNRDLIAQELNVHEAIVEEALEQRTHWSIKPLYGRLGKKLGKKIIELEKILTQMSIEELHSFWQQQTWTFESEQLNPICLPAEDFQWSKPVSEGNDQISQGSLTITFDFQLTPELIYEGMARELVNKINGLRRDKALDVCTEITILIEPTATIEKVLQIHGDYILHETVGRGFQNCTDIKTPYSINGEACFLDISY